MPKPGKRPAIDPDAGPLAPREWDFREVPDEALEACCLWEYGREAMIFGISSAKHYEMEKAFQRGETVPEPGLEQAEYNAFLHAFWNSDEGYVEIYELVRQRGGPKAPPWQFLYPDLRDRLKAAVGKKLVGGSCQAARLNELESLWQANATDLEAARREPGYDREEDFEAWGPSKPLVAMPGHEGEPHGATLAAFAVDFRCHTDEEITADFKKWLRVHRPKSCPEPTRRGHNKRRDWRAALERLAIMRMLHFFTLLEIPIWIPEAWKIYSGKNWYKERKQAAQTLLKLFPFLPRSDPESMMTVSPVLT